MNIELTSPTKARLLGFELHKPQLLKLLEYTNKSIEFEARKTQNTVSRWEGRASNFLIQRMGLQVYKDRLAELKIKLASLKASVKASALFEDEQGLWTYSGLSGKIAEIYGAPIVRKYDLPEFKAQPWEKVPVNKARDYQSHAVTALIAAAENGPAAIEYSTGAGKSLVIRDLLKEIGLPALVVAPSVSIARQLYDELVGCFGKKYVGLYGDGKKEFGKKFVVGIDASITRVEKGSGAYAAFVNKQVVIFDEAHLCPATTVAKIALNIVDSAPYRFFVSATQMRNDGLDMVLDGIIGPVVARKSLKELVQEGFLSEPHFKMVRCSSSSSLDTDDANQMTRKHLYYNREVCKKAGYIASNFVTQMKRPTVILVEEIEQFSYLLPHLKDVKVKFAHGPLTKDGEACVPAEYRDDDPGDLVAAFNAGDIEVLVGTSCISTGTDIRVAEAIVYLQGGKSEIKIKQSLGRGTRGGTGGTVFNPWTGKRKTDFVLVDFDITDVKTVHRHAVARASVYTKTYSAPEYIEV